MSETGETQGWTARLVARFAALRVRNLRFVFGATFVSGLGDGIVGVALAGPLAVALGVGPALIVMCGAAVLLNPLVLLVRDVRNLTCVAG